MSARGEEDVGMDVLAAKLDRQLRLWGREGQQALKVAHIVVLGLTTTATEFLKNVILAGVGSVTIVDHQLVDNERIAANFFLTLDDHGRPVAEASARHLASLNTECNVYACVTDVCEWVAAYVRLSMEGDPARGSTSLPKAVRVRAHMATTASEEREATVAPPSPSLLLLSNLFPDITSASPLVLAGRRVGTPVITAEARGLVGITQTHAEERIVVHTRGMSGGNEGTVDDLRIFKPFPTLARWFNTHDPGNPALFDESLPESMAARGHLPYICLLHHAFRAWQTRRKEEHPDDPPRSPPFTSLEIKEIRGVLQEMARSTSPLPVAFLEGLQKCTTALNRPYSMCPPRTLRSLFNDPRCIDPTPLVIEYLNQSGWQPLTEGRPWGGSRADDKVLSWVVLHGIKHFYETREDPPVLPFCGDVPDITTTTTWYQELRHIYHAKNVEDVSAVAQTSMEVMDNAAEHWNSRQAGSLDGTRHPAAEGMSCDGKAKLRVRLYDVAQRMVANIWSVCLVRFESCTLPELDTQASSQQALGNKLYNLLQGNVNGLSPDHKQSYYLAAALLATQEWQRISHRIAGECDSGTDDVLRTTESDCRNVEQKMRVLMSLVRGTEGERVWDVHRPFFTIALQELLRAGKSEPPSVAAVVGAMAAQEGIKLLQGRGVPSGQPLLYDGVHGCIVRLC